MELQIAKKLLILHSNSWNHLKVCKQMSPGSFKKNSI